MSRILAHLTVATTATLMLVALSGCSSEPEAVNAPTSGTGSTTDVAPSDDKKAAQGGDGDYAFGADRDQIAQAVEEAFATQDGTARWEGDVLVLSVDGDASGDMAGFTQCRVISQLVVEGDSTAVQFANGRVNCADVLAD